VSSSITIFLSGDVMTGRGIDQILRHSCDPVLHEPWVSDSRRYVEIAEERNGVISRRVDDRYVWGDALAELERVRLDARIVNLETAVTTGSDWWRGKGIHYRMHPENIGVVTAAGIDCCVLANNHVLDWGYPGLDETLRTLREAGIGTAGAGRTRAEAEAPAAIEVPGKGRVLVFGFGSPSAGVPFEWEATDRRPGVNILPELSEREGRRIGARVAAVKGPGDIAVASIHWGPNWGFGIHPLERKFARFLVEFAGIDVVHGHSSHHVRGIEVWRGRLILYGCGDFLTDYEGIGAYRNFRDDLGLMYFPTLDHGTGKLLSLRMVPTRIRNFQVTHAVGADARWLRETLDHEGRELGTSVRVEEDGVFTLRWGLDA
jgi:poly-gamma-glutamate capsule biosynthesis protein CapA/YwtB (metallophosphatase superfamily)